MHNVKKLWGTLDYSGRVLMSSAVITQAASYAANVAFVAWLVKPSTPTLWLVTLGLAVAMELALIGLKELLWRSSEGLWFGWTGLSFDWLINTGGLMTWADEMATFPPIAAVAGALGMAVVAEPGATAEAISAAASTRELVGFVVMSALGAAISAAPHILWRAALRDQVRDEDDMPAPVSARGLRDVGRGPAQGGRNG